MNIRGIHAIYRYEMNRSFRTLIQSLVSPVLSTILYFIVFGAAIGSRMDNISNVSYGAFIVPGLIMLTVQMQSVNNASFGIYFPKFIGTTYELLSAPLSFVEIVIGYVGAATTKAFSIGLIILGTSYFFVNIDIAHPIYMILFLFLTCLTFSLLGFIIGIVSDNFEQLNIVPMLIITPLVFLGGSFYTINMLPPFWQKFALLNPIVYLISGFRWTFFDVGDVPILTSVIFIFIFTTVCVSIIWYIFKTGYRIKN
jgi:ABC-2 type transport system permease protein